MYIILCDDDPDDLFFFQEALHEVYPNCSVEITTDGQQLYNLLTNCTISLPDIIFLDLNMPKMNGLEVLKRLRHCQSFQIFL